MPKQWFKVKLFAHHQRRPQKATKCVETVQRADWKYDSSLDSYRHENKEQIPTPNVQPTSELW